jgi:hypothetical protein
VSSALLMGSTTTFAGDLALLVGVHRGETAVAPALAFGVIRHPVDLQRDWGTCCSTDEIRGEYENRSTASTPL